MVNQKLVTISEVCEMFNRHRSTLWVWVDEGKFPKPIKLNGRTLGWKSEAIQDWLKQQEDAA